MTRFAEEMKKVDAFMNQYPQNNRQFIKDIIIYNAIHHPERDKLIAVPLFDEVKEKAPEKGPEPEAEVNKKNVDAWTNL